MTVSVAQRPIYSPSGLSELTRLVLGFIDGGQQWLTWAIYDPVARYRFDDETALVAGVQAGIHASPFTLLPRLGLLVSPVKLMTLRPAELRTLAQAEAADPAQPQPDAVTRIFRLHRLATSQALAAGAQWLRNVGVAETDPMFQAMTLNERLALLALSSGRGGEAGYNESPFAGEAAAFALRKARTPLEFTDYYRVYIDMGSVPGGTAETQEQRESRASQAVATLLPLLFDALDCPRVEGIVAPAEVAAAVDDWQMMGRRLGFSRISLGVQQVVAHSSFRRLPLDQADRAVAAYLNGAQALLREQELGLSRLGQDGASCSFQVRSESETAEVVQDATGIISLCSYRARRPSVAPLDEDDEQEVPPDETGAAPTERKSRRPRDGR